MRGPPRSVAWTGGTGGGATGEGAAFLPPLCVQAVRAGAFPSGVLDTCGRKGTMANQEKSVPFQTGPAGWAFNRRPRPPCERRPSGGRDDGFVVHAGPQAPAVRPQELVRKADHAGLGEVGQLLGERKGHVVLEEGSRHFPPLAQPGGLLLAQGFQSQGTLEI